MRCKQEDTEWTCGVKDMCKALTYNSLCVDYRIIYSPQPISFCIVTTLKLRIINCLPLSVSNPSCHGPCSINLKQA